MTTFKKLCYQNLCRLCISSNEPAVDLFADNGRSIAKISSCLSLKVEENDPLPKTICGRCAIRLDECYDFREACRNAEAALLAFVASIREAAATPEQPVAPAQPMQVCEGTKAWSDATAMTLDNEAESIDVITPTVQLLAPPSAHPVSAQQRDEDGGLDEMMLREDVCELVNSWRLENATDKRNGSFDYMNSLKPNSLDAALAPMSNFTDNRYNTPVYPDSRMPSTHNDRNFYQLVKHEDVLECGQDDPSVWAMPTTSTPSQLAVDDSSSGISSGNTVMTGNAMAVSPAGDIIFLDVIKGNILNLASNSESKIYIVNEEVAGSLGEDTLSGLNLDSVGRSVQTVALPDSTSTAAFPAPPPPNPEKTVVSQVPVAPPVRKKPPPPPEPREFPCPHCHRVFNKATQLAVHRAIHTGEKAHKCDECDKRYFRKEHLSRHVLAAHRPPSGEEFPCPDCGKVFHRKENFTRHTKMHRTYTCEKCQQVLENHALYTQHRNSDCGKKPVDPPPPPRPKTVHQCEVCKKEFSAPYRLRKHARTHLPRPSRSRTKGSRKNSEPSQSETTAENEDQNSSETADGESKEQEEKKIEDKEASTSDKEKEEPIKEEKPAEEKSPVPV